MKPGSFRRLPLLVTLAIVPGCLTPPNARQTVPAQQDPVQVKVNDLQSKLCPDPHTRIFHIWISKSHASLVVRGEVDSPELKVALLEAISPLNAKVQDQIQVLPEPKLGEMTGGIISLSVANGRELPDHKAELGTQWLMGETVRIWKEVPHWLLVQGDDGYLAWIERGSLRNCRPADSQAWEGQSLAVVTAFEAIVHSKPNHLAEPVSDVVMGNRVHLISSTAEWSEVELPDGRKGFLEKSALENWAQWKKERHPDGPAIERTARSFLGRPYLWGGRSPKGMDCSGFTKLVFAMNGILLPRNAAEQANSGQAVNALKNLEDLREGDLLFFGRKKRRGLAPEITHVGIYLGNHRFIQSSQRVRISSLDPNDELFDEWHAQQLLAARRILP